jgi:hypothetical protein
MLRKRLSAAGLTARAAALIQLAVELPAAVLARCLGLDISSAVAWQGAAAGDWHAYAARAARPTNGSSSGRLTAPGERSPPVL